MPVGPQSVHEICSHMASGDFVRNIPALWITLGKPWKATLTIHQCLKCGWISSWTLSPMTFMIYQTQLLCSESSQQPLITRLKKQANRTRSSFWTFSSRSWQYLQEISFRVHLTTVFYSEVALSSIDVLQFVSTFSELKESIHDLPHLNSQLHVKSELFISGSNCLYKTLDS